MERNTGDSEDQYRQMTPGEEEIMRIYEDGIYRASDLVERAGGLWITERISPLLEPTIFTPVETIDSDPELDELLRDSSYIRGALWRLALLLRNSSYIGVLWRLALPLRDSTNIWNMI